MPEKISQTLKGTLNLLQKIPEDKSEDALTELTEKLTRQVEQVESATASLDGEPLAEMKEGQNMASEILKKMHELNDPAAIDLAGGMAVAFFQSLKNLDAAVNRFNSELKRRASIVEESSKGDSL